MPDLRDAWIDAMRAGAFADAWAISDHVLAGRDPACRDDPAEPYHQRWVWDGRGFDGMDVLVRCYHGLGDTIQFARYLPLLARRARSVTLEAQAHLLPLLASMPGIDAAIPFDADRPSGAFACDIEITELPFALRVPPDAANEPYLAAPATPLPAGTIGLCYAAGAWDPARSAPPAAFAPLLDGRPAVTLVTEPTPLPVLNPAGCPRDIEATAALIAGTDLVITVDTMVAHLAGALGRPTWLMLKHEPDWRWPCEGDTTLWYPRTRLYRQRRAGDWTDVIRRMTADLSTHAPRSVRAASC